MKSNDVVARDYTDFASFVTGHRFEEPPSYAVAKCHFLGHLTELCKQQMALDGATKRLTLDEVDAIKMTDSGYWPYNTPPYLWMTVNPEVRLTRGFWVPWRDVLCSLANMAPVYIRENYGKVWALWTRQPTEQQALEEQWDETPRSC